MTELLQKDEKIYKCKQSSIWVSKEMVILHTEIESRDKTITALKDIFKWTAYIYEQMSSLGSEASILRWKNEISLFTEPNFPTHGTG